MNEISLNERKFVEYIFGFSSLETHSTFSLYFVVNVFFYASIGLLLLLLLLDMIFGIRNSIYIFFP